MGKLVLFAAALGAIYFMVNYIGFLGPGPREDGQHVIVETEDLEFRFVKGASIVTSYMVFGGSLASGNNSFSDVGMATLDERSVRAYAVRYADFFECSSPAAAQAKQQVESLTFIASNDSARSALREAISLHEERVRNDAERTCIAVRGIELQPGSVHSTANGSDMTSQLGGALRRSKLVLARSASVIDCHTLLW
jgi:hypothetical protein